MRKLSFNTNDNNTVTDLVWVITVSSPEEIEYSNRFCYDYPNLSFAENDGALQVEAKDNEGNLLYYDLSIEDGNIILFHEEAGFFPYADSAIESTENNFEFTSGYYLESAKDFLYENVKLDEILFDIDADGREERCRLYASPTGRLTVFFYVTEGEKSEYLNAFSLLPCDLTFCIEESALKLRATNSDGESSYIDISIEDGDIRLNAQDPDLRLDPNFGGSSAGRDG